jgi:hypothetical protein
MNKIPCYVVSLCPDETLEELFKTSWWRIFKTRKLINELKDISVWNPKTMEWDSIWKYNLTQTK